MFQKWQREQKMNVKIMKIYIIRYITLKFSGFQDLQFCWPIFRSNTEYKEISPKIYNIAPGGI